MNMPLSGRRKTDGVPAMITVDPAKVLKWLTAAILIPLATWAFRTYDASKLDTTRFVTDSTSRQSDRAILKRLDERVGEMYCADKPPGCR